MSVATMMDIFVRSAGGGDFVLFISIASSLTFAHNVAMPRLFSSSDENAAF
jgi:hypothetical protein